MDTSHPNESETKLDNWQLHEELSQEYARQREIRGGKTIHQLVAEKNAPRLPQRGRPKRRSAKE